MAEHSSRLGLLWCTHCGLGDSQRERVTALGSRVTGAQWRGLLRDTQPRHLMYNNGWSLHSSTLWNPQGVHCTFSRRTWGASRQECRQVVLGCEICQNAQ